MDVPIQVFLVFDSFNANGYLFFFPRWKTKKVLIETQRIGVITNCGAEGQRVELP